MPRKSNKEVCITIKTKTPAKWLFVDTETGDIWMNPKGKFIRANEKLLLKFLSVVFHTYFKEEIKDK